MIHLQALRVLRKYFAALDTDKDAFSNLPLSLAELQANTQFVNSFNTGTLKIQIYPGQESELETYLSLDPALKIVGYTAVVETLTYNLTTGNFDSTPTDLSGTTIQAGLDAITFDGFMPTRFRAHVVICSLHVFVDYGAVH